MAEPRTELADRLILVVEDEYLLATELTQELERCGARVLGPAASIDTARTLMEKNAPDAAVLDINLRSQSVLDLADELAAASVPFVFSTGYDRDVLPARHADVPCHEKPALLPDLMRSLARVIESDR